MAIQLNKSAVQCERLAIADGKITSTSSPRVSIYDISRSWRELLDATSCRCDHLPRWSEKEVAASEVLISTLTYLHRIGCKDIEQLIRDSIRHKRHNK